MRVLLIPPTFKYGTGEYPAFLSLSDFPTGFAFISASLKAAGHQVFGLNPNNITGYVDAKTMLTTELTKRIKEVQPELICLGGLATDYAFLRDAIAIIRGIDTKIPIVLGGQIVTNDAEDIFNILKPDCVIKGDGEGAILSYINKLIGNDVSWILEQPIENIDSLPFPDYTPFGIENMMDNYSMATRLLYRYSRPDPRPFNIVASRGCTMNCSFCVDHHRSYRERSIENVMAEIKESYEKYHFNILIILDELFAVNKKRMIDFCDGVLEGKKKYGWDFDWCFQTHASAKLDVDTLKLAKQAGCFFFSYGIESASPTVLKSMNKKIEPSQIIEAIKLAEEAKIGFGGNLIFGDPAETPDTIAESLSFWLENCKSSFVFLSNISPYPGSAVFEACRAKGMFKDKKEYYEHIDQQPINMTTMPDKTFSGMLSLTKYLEQSWLFVKPAKIKTLERLSTEDVLTRFQGGNYYKIVTDCPYCGKELIYKERLGDPKQSFWLGTGCMHCGRKVKVEV